MALGINECVSRMSSSGNPKSSLALPDDQTCLTILTSLNRNGGFCLGRHNYAV